MSKCHSWAEKVSGFVLGKLFQQWIPVKIGWAFKDKVEYLSISGSVINFWNKSKFNKSSVQYLYWAAFTLFIFNISFSLLM